MDFKEVEWGPAASRGEIRSRAVRMWPSKRLQGAQNERLAAGQEISPRTPGVSEKAVDIVSDRFVEGNPGPQAAKKLLTQFGPGGLEVKRRMQLACILREPNASIPRIRGSMGGHHEDDRCRLSARRLARRKSGGLGPRYRSHYGVSSGAVEGRFSPSGDGPKRKANGGLRRPVEAAALVQCADGVVRSRHGAPRRKRRVNFD